MLDCSILQLTVAATVALECIYILCKESVIDIRTTIKVHKPTDAFLGGGGGLSPVHNCRRKIMFFPKPSAGQFIFIGINVIYLNKLIDWLIGRWLPRRCPGTPGPLSCRPTAVSSACRQPSGSQVRTISVQVTKLLIKLAF